MEGLTMPDLRTSVREDRVDAVARFGFTERQARFLVSVMVYSGVFLNRQYCAFAGISHGQKTHDFIRKLVDCGCAIVITPGALHRGRIIHVHHKPLYEAIGEPNDRNRRVASLGRVIERLMLLDAVLADRRHLWLGTERDKLAYFKDRLRDECRPEDLPHLSFGSGNETTVRYFPDKLPIGVERDSGPRHVFLYLVTRDVPVDFRMFVFRHAELLKVTHRWTVRILVPRRFRKAMALYRRAAREELAPDLEQSTVDAVEWMFRRRAGTADATEKPADEDIDAALRAFRGARLRARYRMWQVDPSLAKWNLTSFVLRDQLARGDGRIEFVELPHQYLRLTSLVGVS
jgi:hypothetical protein